MPMTFNEWSKWSQSNAQQLTMSVDELVQLMKDQNAQLWINSLSPQDKQKITALLAALNSFHAALTPEIRQLLGVV